MATETITRGVDIDPDRFWARVRKGPDCWIWQGALITSGYGNYYERGSWHPAHRAAYRLIVGEIPDGLVLHHECHNPACVNPAHLKPVTRKQHSAEHGLFGAAADHAAASHCVAGHLFDHHDGRSRVCLTCKRKRGREWARRQRGMA